MSPLGGDFPPDRFLRTPISTVRWLLRQLDDRDQAKANIQSLTTARLAQIVLQVAHGFSGSRRPAPKSKVEDFLPFPEWKPASAESEGPDQPTKFVLTELISARRIPLHVFTALITHPESGA